MEAEILSANQQTSIMQRLLSAVVPVLLIAVTYVEPGKWAAAVEAGSRFGSDLTAVLFIFNLAAILCQYLSACVALVTGRDLAKICREEYSKTLCIFLGIQAELSLISLDLSMVLGTAHGLNTTFGIDLFTSVFLSAANAILFPLISARFENGKAKLLSVCWSSFIFLSYVFGVFVSHPDIQLSMGGFLTNLSGESAFTLMSLLGANIMPHNFYLHSSVVQQDQGPANVSKGVLCHDHFFTILCVFSVIFLVNYVLVNSAANVFYSAGLVLLNFQDALSLPNQVFRSSLAAFMLTLVIFFSNQIIAITWDLGKQVVVQDLLRMDIPGWLHHATIRVIVIVPALYSVWSSGAEGVYQLLILAQVVVALLLPSSVIPLFRVASSRSIMGGYKISHFVEFLALVTFIGMLGLNVVFVIELIFGSSDWVTNLRWNTGSSISISYFVLLLTAINSICLMLWLAATPLKSASSRFEDQALNWDTPTSVTDSYVGGDQNYATQYRYHLQKPIQELEPVAAPPRSLEGHPDISLPSDDPKLPDTLLDSDIIPHLEEKKSEIIVSSHSMRSSDAASSAMRETIPHRTIHNEIADGESRLSSIINTPMDMVEKTLRAEDDLHNDKDDEADSWDPEESSKGITGGCQTSVSEGPGSFRSLSGRSDDTGSGTGSLSRLAGLGRAGRRQLSVILDEFWGQLFDFHGQATPEAKSKKFDVVLGVDSKTDAKPASVKFDNRKDFTGYVPPAVAKGSESMMNSNLYISPQHQIGQSGMESSYGAPRGSSAMWASHMQLLDAYVRGSARNTLDSGERRYASMHIPASTAEYDQQPATVHGYELASYLSRIAKERGPSHLNGEMDSLVPKSTPLSASNYASSGGRELGQKQRNGLSTPPGFHNVSVTRNNSMQSGNPTNETYSLEVADNTNSTANVKKFYSLPDISGLSLPYRDASFPGKSVQWDNSVGYGKSIAHSKYDGSYGTGSPRFGAKLRPEEFSPSKVCRDAFSLNFASNSGAGSLWSKQPFEQFGVADRTQSVGDQQIGTIQGSKLQEASNYDLEARLLQSFRNCILKLLKLEGSDWLFRQNDGADEDLIDRVAAREKFIYEAETREINYDADATRFSVMSVPHCGEGCVWRVDLIISFGVWCIRRILELSLMESRPELWGKYTYVLNRLQGVIELAFFRPRSPMTPCFCLQVPITQQQRVNPSVSNGNLPPQSKQGRGKCTNAAMLLDTIKDVELAISCRKGRTGTAAGDVAFPKGKENLVSVLKRYKRRLSNKSAASQESGSATRKGPSSPSPYGL